MSADFAVPQTDAQRKWQAEFRRRADFMARDDLDEWCRINPMPKEDEEFDPEPCDHEWQVQDDSFDHEFGTEKVIYERCVKCDETRPHEPYDDSHCDDREGK